MRSFNALGLGLVALAGFGACSDGGNTPVSKTNIELAVAPLRLDGLNNVCYDLRVRNGLNDLVWSQGDPETADDSPLDTDSATVAAAEAGGSICASRYGNGPGGDVTYIGPCDAQEPSHNVTLWVHEIFTSDTTALPDDQWDNPCKGPTAGTDMFSWNGGCTLNFTCIENQDVAVIFNLAVMRDADQGFFDVAVNFADVFCSAKLDTCTGAPGGDGGNVNNLLFSLSDGTRQQTAVLGIACTGGTSNATTPPGDTNTLTALYLNDLNIACIDGNSTNLEPSNAEGNQGPSGLVVNQWAIYRGAEDLDCGSGPGSCKKLYWNVAIDMNETYDNCTLTSSFTAGGSDNLFVGGGSGWTTPVNSSYPIVHVSAQLTNEGGWNTLPAGNDASCINVQLGSAGMTADYTTIVAGAFTTETFCSMFDTENEAPGSTTPRGGSCP